MLSPPPSHDAGPFEDKSPGARPVDRKRAVDAAFAIFRASLNRSRSRLTRARLRVARWLLEETEHFTEDDVNARLAQRGLPIGRRSVQNTLELLVESGLVLRLHDEKKDETIFIPLVPQSKPEDSLLILCVGCFEVQEVSIQALPKLRAAIAKRAGLAPRFAVHVIHALCKGCRAKKAGPDPM